MEMVGFLKKMGSRLRAVNTILCFDLDVSVIDDQQKDIDSVKSITEELEGETWAQVKMVTANADNNYENDIILPRSNLPEVTDLDGPCEKKKVALARALRFLRRANASQIEEILGTACEMFPELEDSE